MIMVALAWLAVSIDRLTTTREAPLGGALPVAEAAVCHRVPSRRPAFLDSIPREMGTVAESVHRLVPVITIPTRRELRVSLEWIRFSYRPGEKKKNLWN